MRKNGNESLITSIRIFSYKNLRRNLVSRDSRTGYKLSCIGILWSPAERSPAIISLRSELSHLVILIGAFGSFALAYFPSHQGEAG